MLDQRRKMKLVAVTIICFIFLGFCQNLKAENPSTLNDLPDYLINISMSSIQDMISSGIDVNDKIEKKIITLTSELFYEELGFSAIKWNTSDGFVVKKSIPVDVGSAKILFHDFSVNCDARERSGYDPRRFSASVTCNTPKNITLEVKLPTKITINADVLIMQPYSPDIQGSISIALENAKITKHFDLTTNESNSTVQPPSIQYENSEIHLKMEKKFQKLIYDDSGTMLDEVDSLLAHFFAGQLNEEFITLKSTFQTTCSKVIRPSKEQTTKKSDLFNTWYFKDVYVIPSTISEWKGIKLTIGPIIIDGLSYFNNTGPSVLEIERSHNYNNRRRNYVERFVRLRSGPLRGKLELRFFDVQQDDNQDDTNSASVFTFLIDYIQFETEFQRRFDADDYSHRKNYHSMKSINLKFGGTQTKLLESNGSCIRRNQFIDNVVSENLKSVIKNYFLKSVKEKWRTVGQSDGYSIDI